MTKLTTERLEKFVNDIKTDGMCDITDYQVALALRQLLAYEQAAKNPVGYMHHSGQVITRDETSSEEVFEICCKVETPLYAAPVLPKQPELVENIKKVMNNWLAMEPKLAFQPEFTDVMMLLDAEAALAQPVIPEQPEPTISFYRDGIIAAAKWVERQREAYDNEHGQHDSDTGSFEFGNDAQRDYSETLAEIAEGIRSLHPASAQPVSEPYKLPSGHALVPCKLTAENGAKSCMIGEFTEQTEISCPECFGDDECETCDGSGMIEVTVPVSWTTIKDIWAKGIEHFAAAPAQESE